MGVQGWGTPYTVILGWLLVACGDEDDESQGRGNQCDQSPDWEDALDLVQPICSWWGEEASERLGQDPTRLEVGGKALSAKATSTLHPHRAAPLCASVSPGRPGLLHFPPRTWMQGGPSPDPCEGVSSCKPAANTAWLSPAHPSSPQRGASSAVPRALVAISVLSPPGSWDRPGLLQVPDLRVRTQSRGLVRMCRQLRGLFQFRSSLSGSTTGTVSSSTSSTGTWHGGHPSGTPCSQPHCPCATAPLQSPGGTEPQGPAGMGVPLGGLLLPPTHLEGFEEPPVPGLPPPLAVVQGAEGRGEDAQGGVLGGQQGPVLLPCEGTQGLSKVGAPCPPQPFQYGAAVPCVSPGSSPCPTGSGTPRARSHLQQPGGALGPLKDGAEPALSPQGTTYHSPHCLCPRAPPLPRLSASLRGRGAGRGSARRPQHTRGPPIPAGQPLPGSQGPGGASPSPRCRRWIQVQSTTVST